MKRTGLIILLSLTGFIMAAGQEATLLPVCAQGKVLESLSFHSKILGRGVKYSIYLPPDYSTSSRSYPAVYLLHGYTDNETAWVQFGEVNRYADQAIAAGEIPPMIIVMPDAGVTWYVNDYAEKIRYEDMFIQELIPYMEQTYRIRAAKEFRGISGLSMGGYGSLLYSLHHPDMFAACAAFSAAVWTDDEITSMDQQQYDGWLSAVYGPAKTPKDRLSDHYRKNSVLDLVKAIPEAQKKDVRFYIDCGDDDFLYRGNSALHVLMRDLNIPHEYRTRDGGHSWVYWRTGITDGLKFIGMSFHR